MENSIFYRYYDLPANFPVVGLLGNSWHSEHIDVPRQHFHNCLEIGYLYEGRCTVLFGEQKFRAEAPCLVLAPPNAAHITNPDAGQLCGWKWLYVDPVGLLSQLPVQSQTELSLFQYRISGEDCILPGEKYPAMYELIGMVTRELEASGHAYQGIVRELLGAFFLMLMREKPQDLTVPVNSEHNPGMLQPAISYIMAHYMEELDVDDLASRCHLSTSHFRRMFKRIFGWAPLDYIQVTRIQRACTLLFNADYSVTEIGIMVGYPTPSSFGRMFRRFYGISPNQWRKKMRSENSGMVTSYFHSLPPAASQFFPHEYMEQLKTLGPFKEEKGG
jgi:AraC-like DNA-binding protein